MPTDRGTGTAAGTGRGRRWAPWAVLAAAVLGGGVLAGGPGPAAAAPGTPDTLPGFQLVFSNPVSVAAGHWAIGKVSCPKGSVPVDGGAYLGNGNGAPETPVFGDSLNSSYPAFADRSWIVVYTDYGSAPAQFNVAAVCLSATGTVVRHQSFTTPGYWTDLTTMECPGTDVVLGGGVAASVDLYYGLNSSAPTHGEAKPGWFVRMSNSESFPLDGTMYLVCHANDLPHYQIVQGAVWTIDSGSILADTRLERDCPGIEDALGGGGESWIDEGYGTAGLLMTESTFVYNLQPGGWWSSFVNGSNYDASVSTETICAGP